MGTIQIIRGDITRLHVDAIVNAANSTLLGGGGVDGAIHHAAGSELLAACQLLGGCPTGEARITPGFKLKATWVIHTVGPVWHGGSQKEPSLLQTCYENCFSLALKNNINSIAFPAISSGVYRFPKQAAATIALNAMLAAKGNFERITACCFSAEDTALYQTTLSNLIE